MKCTYSRQAYRVKDSEPAIVGVLVLDSHNDWIWHPDDPDSVQLAHSHTRELEFVKTAMLIPYGPPGGEAMPQPASKVEA